MLLIILVVLLLLAVGTGPWYPYNREWAYGYYPSGIFSVILIVLLLLWVFHYLR